MTGGLTDNLIIVLKILCLILILGSIVFYTSGAILTWQFFRLPEGEATDAEATVAILVPVRGIDAGAAVNWASLCEQDYPNYQVHFAAMDLADPAVSIVEQIIAQYPDRASLITDLPPRGPNHKDSNVTYLLEKTTADRIIFTDSDICVAPNYIRRVTAPLDDPAVGMVTCSYIARNPRYVGAALASLARCCDFTPSLLIARQLDGGVKLGIGVTMAVSPIALQQAGGIVCNRIGSDYNLGKRIAAAGYRIKLSRYVLESDTGKESIGQLFERELRWSRTIRFNKGPIYYAQIFCFGPVFCLLLLGLTGFAGWAIGLTIVTLLVRYAQATIATHSMDAPRLRRWFWLLPLRDGLSFVIWLVGGYGRTIYWRGRKLNIRGDGIITAPGES
jgi:ceramide glucosyltransferase